jgi:hypothetical protein
MNKDTLTGLQSIFLNAPQVGSYYYSSLAPRVYECVARITDKYISPISDSVILTIKQIHWQHEPPAEPEITEFFVEAKAFQKDDYEPAEPEHIQRFEKTEAAELGKKKDWKKLK